jgi:RNA polymerase sigma-70 factor (ECF subfamily)
VSESGDTEDAREYFRTIYDAKYRYVLAYALRRTPNEASANDAVADTFLVAWRRLPDVPTGDETLPWLYAVARRVLANQRRGDLRQSHLVQRIGNESGASADDVEHTVMVAETESEAVAALRMLEPDDQELLCLVAWEELSHRQIAGMLGCSENAVAIRVHRARTKLRGHMEDLKGKPNLGHIRTKAALVEGDAS